ncbi:gliding motility lipoprotein GldJ [Hugenholtzia roseola]|uniref:gliding motility lipoprotein GldJ n=1 Tax=Hugenholtzia roseola TaxID=1002 RepID=UPI00041155E3|nr:gliding motility lipoprotein GldJ [Hugenholtzia roseola]
MLRIKSYYAALLLLSLGLLFGGCQKSPPTSTKPGKKSTTTGMAFGKKRPNGEDGGFAMEKFKGQPEGPNLVFIEGGRHVMGTFEENIEMTAADNLERTITIASFYMDETEVANVHWLEYLHYLKADSSEEIYQAALPDTTVWAAELAFNDPYVDHYLRYPGFRYFPVVGISWKQANDFATWRTTVVNNNLAIKDGKKEIKDKAKAGERIPLESGVVLPGYRLPTEAEWEYAAKGLIGTQYIDEMQDYARLYPWDGHSLRNPYGKLMGTMMANYKRGRGDYAGIAGRLNDTAMITDWIYANPPNDFGLYNMAGNVNEWVYDLFRPMSFEDVEDLNPIRRNEYIDQVKMYDPEETLITNRSRIFKGGSWKDVAYWLTPGTRRFIDEDSSTSHIGFRCAMIRAGTNK